ncbi:MAG: YfhO family protein [Flavobacteriales bacterium]|nr:YfhO family protein [Flavobacteriales bacterium]
MANADEEITKLNDINPANQCIVDVRFSDQVSGIEKGSGNGTIKLDSYDPKDLVYSSNSQKDRIAVFSEIYYDKGWNAYIDGQLVPHFRCNYVLRGLKIPAGQHKVEFKFEPTVYSVGEKVSLVCSLLLLIGVGFVGYKEMAIGSSKLEEMI